MTTGGVFVLRGVVWCEEGGDEGGRGVEGSDRVYVKQQTH